MYGLKFTAIATLAASVSQVMATPPACLLACVAEVEKNSQCSSLADLNCICTSLGEKVELCLEDKCPSGDASAAKDAFEASCSEQGYEVSGNSASSSAFESSSSSSAASSSAESSSSEASSAASSAASSSVAASSFVSSSAASTEAPTSAEQTSAAPSTLVSSQSEEAPASSAAVSSYEGGAPIKAASFGAALAGVVGALL